MKANNFVLKDYLKRICYGGEAKADIATVSELMRCQLFTVPFENLDVQCMNNSPKTEKLGIIDNPTRSPYIWIGVKETINNCESYYCRIF
jgi:hypothetical protein